VDSPHHNADNSGKGRNMTCHKCRGDGVTLELDFTGEDVAWDICPRCNGKGTL